MVVARRVRSQHALWILLAIAPSCATEAPARPQIVLYVDTDLPVVGQLQGMPDASSDAAIDTLLVEVLDRDGRSTAVQKLVVPDTWSWPVSFGIVTEPGVGTTRVRLRGYRSVLADPSATGEPRPALTVDRIVDLAPGDDGVDRRAVVLRGDCLGRPATFAPARTCVDAEHPGGDPADGIATGAPVSSAAGTWPPAHGSPCTTPSNEQRACIPGGFAVLGADDLDGLVEDVGVLHAASPRVPVVVSPFAMDRTEYTLGRYRRALQTKPDVLVGVEAPLARQPKDSIYTFCTLDPLTPDDFPLNCVTPAAATRLCEAEGGRLPTEAEWETAARGRNRAQRFPWGDELGTCCTAAVLRGLIPNDTGQCERPQAGLFPVGTFRNGGGCALADETTTGVLDLAGNVGEITRDAFAPYDGTCWARAGIAVDPLCTSSPENVQVRRGGSVRTEYALARAELRQAAREVGLVDVGFRCVYPDGPTP